VNYSDRFLRETASYSVLDVMLTDIAVRIQLAPSDHQKAVDHYEAINEWIDREDSILHKRVQLFYPQGGFMISATTARHDTEADFDIDVMAQIDWPTSVDPETALSTLDQAIRGEPGSRYYKKTERKTRCSTVHYDGMHLDVTPAVRLITREEKTSFIFHSKPSDPSEPKQTHYANPFGFGEWFNALMPADEIFGLYFEKSSLDYDRMRLEVLAKSDADPVPPQMPVYRKSRAVISLQLIKRWRNLAYDRRHPRLRMPPSVLLAYYVAYNANQTRTLADELIHQVECIIVALEHAEHARRTVHEVNPKCEEDVLTDRWPANLTEQRVFIDELRAFAVQLYRLQKGLPLHEIQTVLEDLFGERAARDAVRKYTDQHVNDNKAGKGFHILRSGSIPALGSAAVPSSALAMPRSSPWGD
jgi:Second Messenger Oligonucleotide or Dinucleotide Synthetase domain